MTTSNETLALPVISNNGLGSFISPHFGRAPFHLIVDSEGKALAVLPGDPAIGGKGLPLEAMLASGVTTVICPVIGRKAHKRLTEAGIKVLAASARTVGEAIAAFGRGELKSVSEEMLAEHDREKDLGFRGVMEGKNGECCGKSGKYGEADHVKCCEKGGEGHEHQRGSDGCGHGRGHCCHGHHG